MERQVPLGFGLGGLTPAELEFISYFERLPPRCFEPVEALYRGAGPRGFGQSLLLARLVKIKEGIVSDKELCSRLKRVRLYQAVCNLAPDKVPDPATFCKFRSRLGPTGYRAIHTRLVEYAAKLGLLDPPLPGLPRNRRHGVIASADSTFLITAGSTTGEKQDDGSWKFTDPSARFGRRHHQHRYGVGHRIHTLMVVTGIPLVSRAVGANEVDSTQLSPLLVELRDRYPALQVAYLVLDAGYDAEELYRLAFEEFGVIPVIIQEKDADMRDRFTSDWRPLCPFNHPMRRSGIDYARRRTRWACFKVCRQSKPGQQLQLMPCEYLPAPTPRGFVRYTYFRDSYRHFGPAAPNTQIYEFLKPLRTGIERYYGLVNDNRYRMEMTNTYLGADNVLIHVIEHDIALTLDIIHEYLSTGKMSPVLNVNRPCGRSNVKPWDPDRKQRKRERRKKSAKRARKRDHHGCLFCSGVKRPQTGQVDDLDQ
jgi:hypothetical protein